MRKLQNVDLLAGMRVLLCAHYIPGPVGATLLQNMGAEIIKIEPPFGDFMRGFPPFLTGKNDKKMSSYFRTLNAGFKSVVLDFKKAEDISNFKRLIQSADVIIDGNRTHYLTQKILQCPFIHINKNITHIPITAHGLIGEMKNIAGHDNNTLAMSGALSYTPITKNELPAIFGAQVTDITAGYIAAFSAVCSMFGKQNAKSKMKFETIDVSMLHAATYLNQIYIAGTNVTKTSPLPESEQLNGGLPNYRMYQTKDRPIFFGPIEPNLFENFCTHINRLDLKSLLKTNQSKLIEELKALFKTKTAAEWVVNLKGVDCCFSIVNSVMEAIEDQQINELGLLSKVIDPIYGNLVLTNHPASLIKNGEKFNWEVQPAPELGEHTNEILRTLSDDAQFSQRTLRSQIRG